VARRDGGLLAAGESELSWDGRDDRGRRVAPGPYFVRVTSAGEIAVARVVRVR
jgi:hypothetical protein